MKHNLTSPPLLSENGCISLRNFFIKYLFEIYLSLNLSISLYNSDSIWSKCMYYLLYPAGFTFIQLVLHLSKCYSSLL